jgi:hypothetical protein
VVDEVVKDETDDITDDDDVIAGVTVNERGLYQGSGKRLVLHEALVRKERHVCVHGFVSPLLLLCVCVCVCVCVRVCVCVCVITSRRARVY